MEKILEEIKYNGVRFNVLQRKYKDSKNLEYIRDIVDINDAAVILPIDNNGDVIFIKQYREVVEESLLELPAGVIEKGEDPAKAALREMEEETGLKANKIEHLITVFPSPGYTNEKIYIYVATDFEKGNKHLDIDEHIDKVVKIPYSKAIEMVKNCEISQGNASLALLIYDIKK